MSMKKALSRLPLSCLLFLLLALISSANGASASCRPVATRMVALRDHSLDRASACVVSSINGAPASCRPAATRMVALREHSWGRFDSLEMGEVPDWTGTNEEQGAEYGFSAGPAGDVNGDGYDDIFVGAPRQSLGLYRAGAIFVYHGGPGGISDTANWSAVGPLTGSRFGAAAAPAGDVNGDGYGDLIVGAPRSNQSFPEAGMVAVYHGGPAGLADSPAWEVTGDQSAAQLGGAVAPAGDVNGDGYDDVLAGAGWYDGAAINGGAAFLWLGGPAGLTPDPAWLVTGSGEGDGLGWSLSGAGDIDGDGYDDVLAGAPFADGVAGTDAGKVYLYRGQPAGLAAMPSWVADGTQVGEQYGLALAPAGDANSDGFADFLVGAPGYNAGAGALFLFTGAVTNIPDEPAWQSISPVPGALFGTAVSGGQDVNGDGHVDVLAGAPYYMDDQPQEGGLFVYFGTGRGIFFPGWESTGNKSEAHFGFAAAGAGDVNQDGYADLIAGAPDYRQSTIIVGRAFGFYGGESPVTLHQIALPVITR